MKNKYTPLFAIFLFFCSCEKDSDQKSSVDRLIPDRTIYIAGSSYNSAGDMTACYWVDGVRNELPGGAWATDITVSNGDVYISCLLYTSPSPRDVEESRMPSSA